MARIYVNNVAPISVEACLAHSDKLSTLLEIYVNNVAPISVEACLVHSDKLRAYNVYVYAASMVLTGNSMGLAMKFGINTTLASLKMEISRGEAE